MKKNNGFGLLGVIIIIIVTAFVSSVATGVIMLNNSTAGLSSEINLTNDEELKDFISVYETLITKYYDEIDKEGMLKAAEEGMLNFLGDKYTTYLDDEEYQNILNELSGEYNGIGITIKENKILDVALNSPAERAGILINDVITKVNGVSINDQNYELIGNLIKDSDNNKVSVEVLRDNQTLIFELEKENLINPSISTKIIENTSIGYLGIKNFSQNLGDQVKNALVELEKNNIESLIIDVRDNAGGYLSAAEETASLFLEEGKRIYSLESNNKKYHYKDETKEKRTYKIVVLMNINSASASEILAAALKESYGAILVGTKSYGKGKVQQIVNSAKFTSARWLTPNGNCIDGIGLMPDYSVSIINGDEQLDKAIELLK